MLRRGHNDSSTVATLLAPPKPTYARDHIKDNVRQLADMQEAAAARREAAELPAEPVFKLKRFESVPSKVAASMSSPPLEHWEDAAEAHDDFLKRKTRELPAVPDRYVRPEVGLRKAPVPKATETLAVARSGPKDFIRTNSKALEEARPASASDTGSARHRGAKGAGVAADTLKHEEYGAVPIYLRQRQAEWAEEAEAKKRAEEAKDVPPGMRLMPLEERLETLRLLRTGIEETQNELSKFKLNVVVPSQRKRRGDLEEKLTQLEDAVKVFSRTKVFVKLGE